MSTVCRKSGSAQEGDTNQLKLGLIQTRCAVAEILAKRRLGDGEMYWQWPVASGAQGVYLLLLRCILKHISTSPTV